MLFNVHRSFLLLTLVISSLFGHAQPATSLPRSIPETEGVSSAGILDFLEAAGKSKHEFHSIMMLRHGQVVAEGWWSPYAAGLKHTMYSCSKSFTATAIGFAVQEKLLSVNDKVISFFPDDLPDSITTFLSELRVRDVLSMTDGQEPDPTFTVVARDMNWVKAFFATPIVHEPGTKFLYNTLGTYMLSAIVQKVTGQKTVDYLKSRLFEPLGITDVDWEEDLRGINTGGWGLRINTEGMAKFGQLLLQKGRWNYKQLLPASWVKEASTMKIMQDPDAPFSKRDSSDWLQGYCYQLWRCRNNAYRGDGAFGQFIIVMPQQDAVIAITAETSDMQDEINLVWKYLLPAIKQGKLPEDRLAETALSNKLRTLALPISPKEKTVIPKTMADQNYMLEANDRHLRNIGFHFTAAGCQLTITTDTAVFKLDFAEDKWQQSVTNMPGPSLLAAAKENFSVLSTSQIAGSFHWKEPDLIGFTLRYIESAHAETFECRFENNTVLVTLSNSFDFGKKSLVVKGTLQ